mmetsp:Transcript_71612/g.108155  ORF Transcript_71612/g.108155 Transcript_71612/m.108155 type:complete len:655 (+) Transcript_71612:115-2079(+)|eukprot:CAMPEP_0117022858 /NCGR_PEP_ID=MMETSP0472-20121206/17124_1 /TAXON_ID=693140 ORGANISM="Tiarina fusus, Strain LIS" /NCGR_SAMPLE_ID=MMETSP0472 /ASSEMBLY_ACC=CAM_ASM_000603 /LENGTH=654 /DNA_ID=CAMNT_0004728819 /DNA_START=114 /DNA_END=2078 /DNA_ORIENTATION=-
MAATTSTTTTCDYLVIGGGATGMAFCDTLLRYHPSSASSSSKSDSNNTSNSNINSTLLRVIVLDAHSQPGGHWNDAYDFCRLHQPSHMYGVESVPLEPTTVSLEKVSEEVLHRATKHELLEYYRTVQSKLEKENSDGGGFRFIGNATLDFDSEVLLENGNYQYCYTTTTTINNNNHKKQNCIQVTTRLVDARYLQPDIPKHVKPRFQWNADAIRCVPVNDLVNIIEESTTTTTTTTTQQQKHRYSYFVIVGAGKTGMDAILYLLLEGKVSADHILWIAPNEAWITSRERMGNCMEFLHECVMMVRTAGAAGGGAANTKDDKNKDNDNADNAFFQTTEFLQNGFRSWEQKGKIYRIGQGNVDDDSKYDNQDNHNHDNDNDDEPTQFKDATLDQEELRLLRTIKQVVRKSRLQRIDDDGTLVLADGRHVSLPWMTMTVDDDDDETQQHQQQQQKVNQTLFVHCAAGAFQYTNRTTNQVIDVDVGPIFQPHKLVLQDVYGTPGFCFVGSVLGRLEACRDDDGIDNDNNDNTNSFWTDEKRNAMSLCPPPPPPPSEPQTTTTSSLGPSGGAVGHLTANKNNHHHHPWIQRLINVRQWYRLDDDEKNNSKNSNNNTNASDFTNWLVSNRLFHFKHVPASQVLAMLDETYDALVQAGLIN